jgi:hypothetical protein
MIPNITNGSERAALQIWQRSTRIKSKEEKGYIVNGPEGTQSGVAIHDICLRVLFADALAIARAASRFTPAFGEVVTSVIKSANRSASITD